MHVLVTGGNGFIGSVVVRRLIESGHSVRCLLRKNSNTSRIADLRFERAILDVRDAASLHSAFHGCTHVVHLAGIVNWKDVRSKEMDDVVVGGTRNVLAAAKSAGCRRVVYVSSILAISSSLKPQIFDETSRPDPEMLQLVASNAKIGAEQLCREAVASGLDVVIVNPGEVYGPEDLSLITAGNLVDFAKSFPVFVCSGGTCILHVEDAALGILAALEKGRKGERYILGGENLTVRELAGTHAEAPEPEYTHRSTAQFLGPVPGVDRKPSPFAASFQSGSHTLCDAVLVYGQPPRPAGTERHISRSTGDAETNVAMAPGKRLPRGVQRWNRKNCKCSLRKRGAGRCGNRSPRRCRWGET